MSLDFLFASEKCLSLGVNGVALSSIGTSALALASSSVAVWIKMGFSARRDLARGWDFDWFRRWRRGKEGTCYCCCYATVLRNSHSHW